MYSLFLVFNIVTGLNISKFNQMYEIYWDDLSVTQLLVRRMGHFKKGRPAD